MATVLPFHRLVVEDPAFAATSGDGFTVHTRWIETEWDNTVAPFDRRPPRPTTDAGAPADRGGRGGRPAAGGVAAGRPGPGRRRRRGRGAAKAPRKRGGGKGGSAASGDAVTAPMQGTIIKVAVSDGDQVAAGDLIVVLEAMKMENPVTAHRDGTVTGLAATAGSSVSQGTVLCEIKD